MNIGKLRLGSTPRIAAVILDGKDKKSISKAKRDGADLLELRIDCFKRQDTDYIRKIMKDVIKEAHRFKKRVIVSYHDFRNTPAEGQLSAIIKNSRDAGGDIVKIASFAKDKKDITRLASLTASHNDIITIAMGRLGIVSRLFFPMLGSLLTYCSVTKSSAPGQMPLKTTAKLLKEIRK